METFFLIATRPRLLQAYIFLTFFVTLRLSTKLFDLKLKQNVLKNVLLSSFSSNLLIVVKTWC